MVCPSGLCVFHVLTPAPTPSFFLPRGSHSILWQTPFDFLYGRTKLYCVHVRFHCVHVRLHCVHVRLHSVHIRLHCVHVRLHCVHVPHFFIHPAFEGCLSWFWILATVNRAMVIIDVQVSLESDFQSLEHMQGGYSHSLFLLLLVNSEEALLCIHRGCTRFYPHHQSMAALPPTFSQCLLFLLFSLSVW